MRSARGRQITLWKGLTDFFSAWSITPISLIRVLEGHAFFLGEFLLGCRWGGCSFYTVKFFCGFYIISFPFLHCVVGPARWNKFTGCCSVLKCTGKDSFPLLLVLLSSKQHYGPIRDSF